MTECNSFQDLLLTASPAELRGDGDTPLARHLAACASCRERAQRFVALTEILAHRLDTPAGVPDVEAILAQAQRASGAGMRAPEARAPGKRSTRRHLPWLGLAAAAVLAAVLFRPVPRPTAPSAGPVPDLGPAPGLEADLPLVESTPGNEVAVLPTADPDITILWFF